MPGCPAGTFDAVKSHFGPGVPSWFNFDAKEEHLCRLAAAAQQWTHLAANTLLLTKNKNIYFSELLLFSSNLQRIIKGFFFLRFRFSSVDFHSD